MLRFFDALHTMDHASQERGILMCDQCLESCGYPEKTLEEAADARVKESTNWNCFYCDVVMCQHTHRQCLGCGNSFCYPCGQVHKHSEDFTQFV